MNQVRRGECRGSRCRVDRGKEKHMKVKITALALGAMLFALCSSAEAQQPKKVPRIGYLSKTDPVTESARAEAVRLALARLAT